MPATSSVTTGREVRGDENRQPGLDEVIPGHEFVGQFVQLDDAAASRWGLRLATALSQSRSPCWKVATAER